MISVEKIRYYKPHWHDELLVFAMVLEGSIEAAIRCRSFSMKKGDILLTGTGEVHSFRKTEEDNTVLFLRFDSRLLEKEFPGIREWKFSDVRNTGKENDFDIERLRFLIAETAVSNSLQEEKDAVSVSRLIKHCRDKFLSTAVAAQEAGASAGQADAFLKLTSYIEKNHANQVSIGEVSEFIGLSVNDTSLLVKQIAGFDFSDYLNRIRCLAAERMLASTGRRIGDIALDCGFKDGRALGRCFKNQFGILPAEYRQEIEKSFPEAGIAAFDRIHLKAAEVLHKIEEFMIYTPRTIILDLENLPKGSPFTPPVLGHPENNYNLDGCNALPGMISGILEGGIRFMKQTDDAGPFVFNGDCGLATHRGIKKAAFHVFEFLSGIKSIIINEEGIAAGICRNGLRIILYPLQSDLYGKSQNTVRFIFTSHDNDYIIKHFLVDGDHGNPRRLWEKLDSPPELSPELEELFINHSIPKLDLAAVKNRGKFELSENLPEEGAVMIEITETQIL